MAKFNDMHQFVRIVREYNQRSDSDPLLRGLTEDSPQVRWLERNEAIDTYAKQQNIARNKSEEVYEDTVKFGYIHPHSTGLPKQDKRLKVTPEGRHLLERGGVSRAWANNNSAIATIIISVIGGVVLGGITTAIALLSLFINNGQS